MARAAAPVLVDGRGRDLIFGTACRETAGLAAMKKRSPRGDCAYLTRR